MATRSGIKVAKQTVTYIMDVIKVMILFLIQVSYGSGVACLLISSFTEYEIPYKKVFISFLVVRMLILKNEDKTIDEDTLAYVITTTICLIFWVILKVIW